MERAVGAARRARRELRLGATSASARAGAAGQARATRSRSPTRRCAGWSALAERPEDAGRIRADGRQTSSSSSAARWCSRRSCSRLHRDPRRATRSRPAARVMAGVIGALRRWSSGRPTAFAVVNAQRGAGAPRTRSSPRRRREAAADEPTAASRGQGAGRGHRQAPAAAATELDVTSPDDGSLVFEPDGLQAAAGHVTHRLRQPLAGRRTASRSRTAEGNVLAESDRRSPAASRPST